MHCDYLPQDYAARMDGGVAFYDGKPVYILAGNGAIVIATFPDGVKIKSIHPDDPLLDLASPKLGYVNTKDHSYYAYRKPERKYKQTLTYGAVSLYDPSGKQARMSIDALFLTENFKDMLLGKYPKLETVLALFESTKKPTARAISRNVCLVVDSFGIIRVHYKMEEVGHIKPGEKTVRVPKSNVAWVVSKYLENFNWVVE